MKKLLLTLTLVTGALAASAQYNLITGIVTDCHGDPVVGHPVTIVADSIPGIGYYYYHTVYTDAGGGYLDTVPYPGTPGVVSIYTADPGYPYGWYSDNHTVSSPIDIYESNFAIACDTVLPNYDTIHTTIYGWINDCSGNPLPNSFYYYWTDSSYNVNTWGSGNADSISAFYSIDVSYSGGATLPFPVYLTVSNYPYPGVTTDTVWVMDTTTIVHTIYTDCTPPPCAASFWTYYDSTGMSGNDTLYLSLNYTSMNPGAATVSWDFGDGSTATGVYTIHDYAAAGIYNVCVTVNNAIDSCTVTYCDSIEIVTRSSAKYIKTMPAPGSALGIKKPAKTEHTFNVYPNPASNMINISSSAMVRSVRMFDMSGREVINLEQSAASSQLSLDINHIENGMYILQLFNANNELLHTHNVLKH